MLRPLDRVSPCHVDQGSVWQVPERLSFIKKVGSGSYGSVVGFYDNRRKDKVAVKKIGDAFRDLVDAKRTLREIKILRQLLHENIIQLKDIFPSPSPDFEDIYIVSELVETDLHRVIYSRQEITAHHCQYFLYQLIRGLVYLHSANLVHRDLKPSNLLVDLNCDLKICDFGLSRGLDCTESGHHQVYAEFNTPKHPPTSAGLTDYVVTRWYRAPELLLDSSRYDAAIDMWSVGCIFAELLCRRALFTGKNNVDQLRQIVAVVGTPNDADLSWLPKTRRSTNARSTLGLFPYSPRASLYKYLPKGIDDAALDLLAKLLRFNPTRRITAHECLRHPYFDDIHDPEDEILWDSSKAVDWTFNGKLTKRNLQNRIYEEMLKFNPMMAVRDAHLLVKRNISIPPSIFEKVPELRRYLNISRGGPRALQGSSGTTVSMEQHNRNWGSAVDSVEAGRSYRRYEVCRTSDTSTGKERDRERERDKTMMLHKAMGCAVATMREREERPANKRSVGRVMKKYSGRGPDGNNPHGTASGAEYLMPPDRTTMRFSPFSSQSLASTATTTTTTTGSFRLASDSGESDYPLPYSYSAVLETAQPGGSSRGGAAAAASSVDRRMGRIPSSSSTAHLQRNASPPPGVPVPQPLTRSVGRGNFECPSNRNHHDRRYRQNLGQPHNSTQ